MSPAFKNLRRDRVPGCDGHAGLRQRQRRQCRRSVSMSDHRDRPGRGGRRFGFPLCLEQVLVKVSGDPRLIGDPEVATLAGQAATFVTDFAFRDRMAGIPVHDEQGTRDRPYDLTVRFDPAKIDAALRSLGREPWSASRPRGGVRRRGSRRNHLPARERRHARTRPARSARGGSRALWHADGAAGSGGAGGGRPELPETAGHRPGAPRCDRQGDRRRSGAGRHSSLERAGARLDRRLAYCGAGARAIDGRSAASASMTRFAAPCPALRRSSRATGSRRRGQPVGQRRRIPAAASGPLHAAAQARLCALGARSDLAPFWPQPRRIDRPPGRARRMQVPRLDASMGTELGTRCRWGTFGSQACLERSAGATTSRSVPSRR